jgi:hypothetical protein
MTQPWAAPTFSANTCWIWGETDPRSRNEWRYFRREFDIPANMRRATLLLTADSRYECRINGGHLGRGFTPHGAVIVAWRVDDAGKMQVEYHAPAGCEVELILP